MDLQSCQERFNIENTGTHVLYKYHADRDPINIKLSGA